MLFDTHAHLDSESFSEDREKLINGLQEKRIRLLMNPGCSISSSIKAVELADRYPFIYAAVGCHPDAANEVNTETLDLYEKLCRDHEKIKAIGEIGLDYHYEEFSKEIQQKAFHFQLELASSLKLPVIVHERDAHEDGMRIIRDHRDVTGVFHCYSGSLEMAKKLVDMGWYIGFTGVITFKNARRAVEVAASIPKDRIVLETDCPYMAPEPFRGRRNDPGYLYRMAEKLGEIWDIPFEEVCNITTENGKRLYRI